MTGAETLAAAFVGGVLTSASPCVLAAVPVAVGFVGGQGRSARRAWLLSGAFVLGTTLALTALGMAAARLGLLMGVLPGAWSAAVGLLVVGLGLWLWFGQGAACSLGLSPALQQRLAGAGVPGALVLGALLGTVMSPCATPALAAALALAGSGALGDGSTWYGAALLAAYGLGHSALLLVAGALPATAHGLMQRIAPLQAWLPGRRVFAVLLAGAGGWWVWQAVMA
jgi:cytochrome c-type biogenesis protein